MVLIDQDSCNESSLDGTQGKQGAQAGAEEVIEVEKVRVA